jgi:hypothetical protein
MSFTGHENHSISFEDAADLTKNYREQMSIGQIKGGYFSKEAVLSILDQENCVGIRYFYGLDESDRQVLVVVGVDENEDDLIGEEYVCIEMSIPCPSRCGRSDILNS